MKRSFGIIPGLLVLALALPLARVARAVNYTATRTQSIQLQQGWNAVYFEVSPTNSNPAAVFGGMPVDVVATHLRAESSVQFIQDPATIGWNKAGWGVWYGPSRTDSFLSTLTAVTGNRAYLVHALRACSMEVAGYVLHETRRWQPDSFNLVGFTVDAQSPPTFEKYFRGSKAHRQFRIYRLENERWTLVTNPQATPMRAGEAFWIHCRGGSDYQGPLRVQIPGGMHLTFLDTTEARLVFANESQDPGTVVVEQFGAEGVPLVQVTRSLGDEKIEDVERVLSGSHTVTTLEPAGKLGFRLRVRRESMSLPMQSGLLKISNGAGAVVWVPVVAHRSDLASSAAVQNQ